MTGEPTIAELNGFLATYEDPGTQQLFAEGDNIGEWKVTGLLGRGGNAEVYRVVRTPGTSRTIGTGSAAGTDGRGRSPSAPQPQHNENTVEETVGALKILHRIEDASKTRFRQEVTLLSAHQGPHLAKLHASGETNGRPYLITELLEPVDLPETEKEVSDYLLAVCEAVAALHRAGLIHRDIKPSNIMRRANGELVLIDLGLVKDVAKSSEPEKDVSIVSSRVVAVGTPRFAAPEQMSGGAITPAADIHALGRLADMAFHSNPPRCWLPIIRRATSSIPEQRYATVEDMAKAIRRRHRPRYLLAASIVTVVALTTLWLGRARTPSAPEGAHVDAMSSSRQIEKRESAAWESLCKNVTTNLLVKELAYERLATNKIGNSTIVIPERAYRRVQKPTDVTLVRLNGQTKEFARPIVLDASREYFIEGPGVLSASLVVNGGAVRVHLKNCFLFYLSTTPIDQAGIRYILEGGAYLNFVNQDELPQHVVSAHIEGFGDANNEIRFKGPTTKQGLQRIREKESRERMNRDAKSILKNLHFPCRILPSTGKYTVEDMEDSIYKKYGIDPNRIPTDAEVETVASLFGITIAQAREILRCRVRCVNHLDCRSYFMGHPETRQEASPSPFVANKQGQKKDTNNAYS